jgi:hypothetical protein
MDGANIPGFDHGDAGQPGSFGLATNRADVNRIRIGLLVAAAAAALLALAAGCGSDSSGEDSSASTEVSIPPPTSPLPTSMTTATSTATEGGKKKPAQTTTSATGGSAPCSIPDAYQDFEYTGIDCSAAVALATEWDRNGDRCNTIDNPNSPQGYNRTCSVEGFSCTAKRDRTSDARFVTCTQGGQSIRFTWLPA